MTTTIFGVNGNGATGPAASNAFTGNIVLGTLFKVTAAGYQLTGYGLWRCDTAQSATASFALWQATGAGTGTLVASSAVSISGMTAGAWNYVPLSPPLNLASGTAYKAQCGIVNNFPFQSGMFNAGVYKNGIINGALTCFSDAAGTLPDAFSDGQCTFATTSSDPSALYVTSVNNGFNGWLDVQVAAPAVVQGPPLVMSSGKSLAKKLLLAGV